MVERILYFLFLIGFFAIYTIGFSLVPAQLPAAREARLPSFAYGFQYGSMKRQAEIGVTVL